ncbi:unnamed protein product [Echinostoma caproni]|uniref:Serine/threonine-protein kinase TOR n=1 Tax=Echinostoma caproni TaxID=27848 RepID=A0A183AYE9_9TREM|nr:unnamed protein product [Echinostoma caproni]
MEWLFQCLRRDREKPTVLISLALIGYHMGLEFINRGFLTQLLPLIQSYLSVQKEGRNKKRSAPLETAAILSIGILVKSLGSALHEPIKQVLDAMVTSGLNQPLISTCRLITEHIPQLRKEIQDRILSDISLVLMHNSGSSFGQTQNSQPGNTVPTVLSFIPNLPGALTSLIGPLIGATNSSSNQAVPASGSTGTLAGSGNVPLGGNTTSSSATSAVSRVIFYTHGKSHLTRTANCGISCTTATGSDLGGVSLRFGTLPPSELSPEVAVVALALRTLGSFNFEGHALAHFVRHISENFISVTTCEVKEVRLEAVKTCARLMVPWLKSVGSHQWYARPAVNTVADILGKLLTVGTSDPDPDVRRCVFDSIDRGFDPHLAQADHLLSLFLALQDEVFDIRVSVLQRLGRLSDINPACVQPNLRKVLLHVCDN